MRITDHFRIIVSILSQSVFASIATGLLLLFAASGFIFDFVLTEHQKQIAATMIQSFLGYWPHLFVLALLILIVTLHRRLLPRVDIKFRDGGQFRTTKDGVVTYRVELFNYGDWQEQISFRIDNIEDRSGAHILDERKGMQREAGVGPMPLSPDSPKYGYLVRMDEASQNSQIEVLTVSDLSAGYKQQPIWLPRDEYVLFVSLNPRRGRPHKAMFSVRVDNAGHLRVCQV